MNAFKQFFSLIAILCGLYVVFTLSQYSVLTIGPWLMHSGWIFIFVIGIIGIILTRFVSPFLGLGLGLGYNILEIKWMRNFSRLSAFLYLFGFFTIILGMVATLIKDFHFVKLMIGLFIACWLGNIGWYTTAFFWEKK